MSSWLPDDAPVAGGAALARTVERIEPRGRARLTGRIRSLRVAEARGPRLEATVDDGTGTVVVRWTGRRGIPGLEVGTVVTVEGTVRLEGPTSVLLDPFYRIEESPAASSR